MVNLLPDGPAQAMAAERRQTAWDAAVELVKSARRPAVELTRDDLVYCLHLGRELAAAYLGSGASEPRAEAATHRSDN